MFVIYISLFNIQIWISLLFETFANLLNPAKALKYLHFIKSVLAIQHSTLLEQSCNFYSVNSKTAIFFSFFLAVLVQQEYNRLYESIALQYELLLVWVKVGVADVMPS